MNTKSELLTRGTGTLERPLYSPGLLLEDTDLTSGVDYTRRLTQLLFSSLFGCGVICGLRVSAQPECNGTKLKITVEKGLGLDCAGNPIEVPKTQVFTYDAGCDGLGGYVWVVACYVDRKCSPRELSCGGDDAQDRAFTRLRAGFEIKVYTERPSCACSCEEPSKPEKPHSGRCCPSDEKASAEQPDTGEVKNWSCYDDHMNGVCACGCDCNCILIGKFDLTNGNDGRIEVREVDGIVRRIRPLLIGQWREMQAGFEQGTGGGGSQGGHGSPRVNGDPSETEPA